MRIVICDAAGRSELVEKNALEGRASVRLAHGQRLEVLDPRTGRVPADLRAHRGGEHGQDLILESNGEAVAVEGFFGLPTDEQIAAISFLENAVAELAVGTAEIAPEWDSGSAIALAQPDSTGFGANTQSGAGAPRASSGGSFSGGAVAHAGLWAGVGVGGAVALGAALDDDDADPPAPTFSLTSSVSQVDEGGDVTFTLATTNVKPGTEYGYQISGVSSSDVEGGSLTGTVTIGADGKAVIQVSLKNDLTTEGVESLTLTIAGQTVAVTVNDTSSPTFVLTASAQTVDEGGDVTFTLQTTNVAPGTQYEYEISGVQAADVVGGKLTGTATVDANGVALIPVSLVEDSKSEGAETLKLTIAGRTVAVTVHDTSSGLPQPTFALTAGAQAVDEGADVTFTLQTTNVAPGTQYEYAISGVQAADVVGGKLTGTATVDANGVALIPVSLVADSKSEGAETLKLTIAGQTVAVTVNDTSSGLPQPTFALTASAQAVDEGADVTFTLQTTNVAPGTQYEYAISGVQAADVVGGKLTGTATVDANGVALIPVSLVEDSKSEGAETLKLTIAGQTVAVTVNDTSSGLPQPTFALTASAQAVDEGADVTFTLQTTNVAPGTQYEYAISGVQAADVVGGKLTGTATVDANGVALIPVSLVEDSKSEGAETLKLTIAGQTVAVTVNDTSSGLPEPTFALTASAHTVDEGGDVIFTLQTTNVAPGTQYEYAISGVQAADVVGGKLTGTATVDANGVALIPVSLAEDFKSEGAESLTLTIAGQTATVTVNDTSTTPPTLLTEEQDLVELDAADNAVHGVSKTYTPGDIIDGGAGYDRLDLVLDRSANTSGIEVKNVEQVDVQAVGGASGLLGASFDGVTLDMSRYDDSVENVDVHHSTDSLYIRNQQSLVDISVSDSTMAELELDYTAGAVAGENDVLSLSVSNLSSGEGCNHTALSVDERIEAIDLSVGGRQDEASHLSVHAPGVTGITVSGGVTGQALSLHLDEINEARGYAELDAAEFAGDVILTGIGGGDAFTLNEISRLTLGAGDAYVSVGYDGDSCGEGTPNDKADLVEQSHYDLGDGNNLLRVAGSILGTVTIGDGNGYVEVGQNVAGSASVTFGVGNSWLSVTEDITDDATVAFGGGNNMLEARNLSGSASVIFEGDGANMAILQGMAGSATLTFSGDGGIIVTVESDIADNATLSFGDGTNYLSVDGSILGDMVAVTFGNGYNVAAVGEDVCGAQLTFGESNDILTIGGDAYGSTIDFGDGYDLLTVDRGVYGSTILGDGKNWASISRSLADSAIAFGGGDDWLDVGRGVRGSTVDLGDGQNRVSIEGWIKGSHIEFGSGDDVLTLGGFGKGPVVRGDGEDSPTVIELGAGDDSVTIEGSKYGSKGPVIGSGAFLSGGEGDDDSLTIRAVDNLDLVARTSTLDAGISGFETLNLVALNPTTTGEETNDNDESAAHITVDFDLVEGVTQINLRSETTLRTEVNDDPYGEAEIVDGAYTKVTEGSAAEFTLLNLPAALGGHISVSGNEVTATGNRQVVRITIDPNEDARTAGDTIKIAIGDWEYEHELTPTELEPETGDEDAANIAAAIAEAIAAAAEEHGFTVARDGHILTLIGSGDCNVDVTVEGAAGDAAQTVQDAASADDDEADVKLNVWLGEDAGEGHTLTLDIAGTGNFDLDIDAAGEEGRGAYENLTLNVLDGFSHHIDTDKNGDDAEFVGGTIVLQGGVAGASIAIGNVMAKNVTSTSAADVTIRFDKNADDDEDFSFGVTTGAGDDTVIMKGVTLAHDGQSVDALGSTIDLGEGADRLVIGNGRQAAAEALTLPPAEDDDRMFGGVRNVEELVFDGCMDGEADGIAFNQHAYDAGFERLTVTKHSELNLLVAGAFARDLEVVTEKNVDLDMQVANDDGITIAVEADDRLNASITLRDGSNAKLTLDGGTCTDLTVDSAGSGDVDVALLGEADVTIDQSGSGNVAVVVGADSRIAIARSGTGDVEATLGARSTVELDGGEHDGDLSVVQLGSQANEILLANLTAEQNVTVDITVTAGEHATVIRDFGESSVDAYGTSLNVAGLAGIDSLLVRSAEGASSAATVAIRVDDAWAVDSGGEDWDPRGHAIGEYAADMTIDLSEVVGNRVVVDALDEQDAQLEIVGSSASGNWLFGGAASDHLVGGDGDDILYGGRGDSYARSITVTFGDFEGEDLPIGRVVLTLSEAGTEDVARLTVEWGTDGFLGEDLAAAIGSWLENGAVHNAVVDGFKFWNNTSNVLPYLDMLDEDNGWSVDGNSLTLFLRDTDVSPNVTFGKLLDGSSGNNPYAGDVQPTIGWEDRFTSSNARGDILEGGAGDDLYVVDGGNLETMDTIVGLDLDDGDKLAFGSIARGGEYEGGIFAELSDSSSGFNFEIRPGLTVEHVVNAGEVMTLEGDDLQAAVATLFDVDGAFTGEHAQHAAGLFQYGDDTFLIATGADATDGFGDDDVIVKVTGVTGLLTLDDFYVPIVN